jgi:hypothetical protein
MIPKACRELLDLCLDVANKTENEQLAQVHIERATGMVNCLLTCGHITPLEHASEMAWVDLARAVRRSPTRTENTVDMTIDEWIKRSDSPQD